ncbi:MAG TPA: ABC transporter substrate-binding protein [Candidatus Competibacteraceae bacterium]|nr:ABC transporter substrate-binding protein [Candidatus Competibacteraceae bacterium]
MNTLPLLLTLLFMLLPLAPMAQAQPQPIEPPFLRAEVEAGRLPPVAERLPRQPLVDELAARGLKPGLHGGTLRMLMTKDNDIRLMVTYGYARLVGYDEQLNLVPDILAGVDVEDDRVFTLHLRPGHRWSDGQPFTSEDFRYWWEDVVNDKDLSPFGPPRELIVQGEPPQVEILDETTVRYRWSRPNPFFLPALAGARPLYIYEPAHYLKQFHAKYVDKEALNAQAKAAGIKNWAGFYQRRRKQYDCDNPDLPTLDPWHNTTPPPAERFVFTRNPYYHRIDGNGRQLPYVDQVVVSVVSKGLIPVKTGAGDADLQARYLRFDDYTFLKASEKQVAQRVLLWRKTQGAQVALYPNLNVNDPVWQALNRDVRFRRALSLAIDRHEINQVVYFGLVEEGNNTVLKESPLFRPEYRTRWAEYDPARANALLDELGLPRRGASGLRLLPDGRPMEITVETAGESTEETDVLSLIHDAWLKIGIKLYSKPSQREVFRNRIFAGDTVMAIWSGLDNGIPNADMSPQEFAPTVQDQLQWPKWGQYRETMGKAGEPPDLPAVQELLRLYEAWSVAGERDERERIWRRVLEIWSDQVFSIGVVSGAFQPVIAHAQLRNVPERGIYGWDPGAHFGIYRPERFWYDGPRREGY